AHIVYNRGNAVAFLDHRPLFEGHTLVVSRTHYQTLVELPRDQVDAYFGSVQLLAAAVRDATGAAGTFIAINNHVSQSVPHLHTHVVPRRPKDGLRGFFWPRKKYASEEAMENVAALIRRRVEELSR
ncbi:MAG TPA: HIT family protein, partial [Actinomycetota bacterium]|nr:HIT family protein [Actinomycetota bacterium]